MATSVIYRLFTRGRRREVHHFHGDVFLTSGGGGGGGFRLWEWKLRLTPPFSFIKLFRITGITNYETRDAPLPSMCV